MSQIRERKAEASICRASHQLPTKDFVANVSAPHFESQLPPAEAGKGFGEKHLGRETLNEKSLERRCPTWVVVSHVT
jgi:hypothetical protein